ncbi:hypothetical protein M422DRAFT_236247 [Sphaerobolus stellatus SS14]|uniref:Unplaced genomic scaffold SPHSTscaffold_272, whole genome shotgun sequence n=1 Tax=Sphaerobolus stellatus (strain SS14) TaxID=990650 RepID=A0A0C9UNL9_SPHS4|nr:hypothetical protein M422DRAFT_236247 [Sphaerobolus stellatus SS14]
MFSFTAQLYLISLIAIVLVLTYAIRKARTNTLPFPPGPKPLPILGNLLDMPKFRPWDRFMEWRKQYGDIVHVTVFGRHIIILNSLEIARDLLDGRSAKYSSRAYNPMMHEPSLMDCEWVFAFRKSDEAWKRQRKLFVQHLGPSAVLSFHERQLDSAHAMLRLMLNHKTSDNLEESLKYNLSGLIMDVTYGYEVKPENDEFVELATTLTTRLTRALHPNFFAVNNFPWLKYIPAWFPGADFKTFAEEARKNAIAVRDITFEYCKAAIEAGMAKPSFVGNAILAASNGDETTDARRVQDIKEIASIMFVAGNDTTAGVLYACILALVLHPRVQKCAHAELDTVLGSPDSPNFRLPTHADRISLPYIDAIVKEVLRWWQPLPGGVTHCTTEDDIYRGFKIPKGSRVIANVWGIMHDETLFPQPNEFRPERFLVSKKEDITCDPALSGLFGWGRRICLGRPLAESSLWIQIASILAAFHLDPAKDETGKDIDVSYAFDREGFELHPIPFPCFITPRSKNATARILETATS